MFIAFGKSKMGEEFNCTDATIWGNAALGDLWIARGVIYSLGFWNARLQGIAFTHYQFLLLSSDC